MFLCAGAGFVLNSSKSITGNVIASSSYSDYWGVVGFIFLLAGLALLVSGKSLRDIVDSKKV